MTEGEHEGAREHAFYPPVHKRPRTWRGRLSMRLRFWVIRKLARNDLIVLNTSVWADYVELHIRDNDVCALICDNSFYDLSTTRLDQTQALRWGVHPQGDAP